MKKVILAVPFLLVATGALAQVTPAAGHTPPDDTPKFNIGATIFGDYTYFASPSIKDSDNNTIHNSAFNVSRAYVNLFGNLNHWINFRITPDIARETGTGSSLNGSLTFRLKYAFAQFNLDDWTTHGSWIRAGINQTPLVDYEEGIYRYRFQGTTFTEREGYLTSSDAGISGHYVFPGNYGDVHAGYYNGEGYSHTETNNEKAFQIRASLRPMPLGGIWKGLRLTAFIDDDHYVSSAKRTRLVGQVTFESSHFNAGLDAIDAKDQTSVSKSDVEGKGWSVWLNPRLTNGWEALLRHDDTKPNHNISSQKHKRDIVGIAYWFQGLQRAQSALMVDYDRLHQPGFNKPDDTRYGLKMLVNF
ncbi:MAG TPA: hypothetical protein VJ853_08985 [Thermoanaerobaculia bacterium]|nr:hypothetical protein [Thermoanaerobaculia bacterium]